MLTPEEVKTKHLVIATPCYGGQVFQNYFMSVLRLVFAAQQIGLTLSFIVRGGDSLIPRQRNSIVAEFMASPQYTHLLWIDADIGFEPDQVFRLLVADYPVAGGVYPLKKIVLPDEMPGGMKRDQFEALYANYPFNPTPGAQITQDGFIEVLDLPTGMMMIRRDVFEHMAKQYPGLRYKPDFMLGLEELAPKINDYHFRFYDVMTEENGRYLSEDYAFCRRYQKIGGKVMADIQSNLTHQGTHMYQGNFFKSLMAKGIIAAPPQPESATNVPASAAEIGTQSGYATHQIEGLPPENPANA
jgi:hypothetical protein